LTSGSVLFSNGTTISQDNSAFFWDNTNKSLKLSAALSSNTEAPLIVKNLTAYSAPNYNQYSQLWKNSTDTVIGYFRADGRLYTSNSVNTNYFTGNIAGTNAAPIFSAATGYGVLFPNLNSVAISTASSERLRIDSTGGVGINTSTISTNSKLHVLGGVTQQNPSSNGITNAATAANSLVFNRSGDTVNNFYAGYAFGGYLSFGYTGDSFSTYNSILNLSTSGNIGVATSAPTEKLDVNGAVQIRGARVGNSGEGGFLDYSAGKFRFLSQGQTNTTAGEFLFTVRELDFGGSVDALYIGNTGNLFQ
jgi:hypothetical protein